MDERFAKMVALAESGKMNTEIGEVFGIKRARVAQIFKTGGRFDLCGYGRRSARAVNKGVAKARTPRTLPTKAEVRAAILYDPARGTFHWKERADRHLRWNARFAGKIAGALNIKHGYYEIRLNNVLYYGHQIAWIHENGEIPAGKQIDHKDSDRSNNRQNNLRLATPTQNNINRRPTKGRKLPKGVTERNGKYLAMICDRVIGRYRSVKEAATAYREAATEQFGEFSRVE